MQRQKCHNINDILWNEPHDYSHECVIHGLCRSRPMACHASKDSSTFIKHRSETRATPNKTQTVDGTHLHQTQSEGEGVASQLFVLMKMLLRGVLLYLLTDEFAMWHRKYIRNRDLLFCFHLYFGFATIERKFPSKLICIAHIRKPFPWKILCDFKLRIKDPHKGYLLKSVSRILAIEN